MPLLLTDLGASNLAIGLVPAIQSLGALMPGILVAPFLERLPPQKRLFVALGLAERLFILSMAGIVAIWGRCEAFSCRETVPVGLDPCQLDGGGST